MAVLASAPVGVMATALHSGPEIGTRRMDHVVDVDGQSVHVWEMSLEAGAGGRIGKDPVVVFLHGGTWSGRPNFDLGFQDYSAMQQFTKRGWATFAVDCQGYGQSSDPVGDSWCEAKDAVHDVRAAVDRILELRKMDRVHLVGWSWGSQVAALFAQEHPELVERVVLYGTRWQPYEDAPDAPTDRFRTNDDEGARSDFIEGCFDPALVDAYAKAALRADPDTPNGVFRDYFVNLPIIDPAKLIAPTLIIAGEHEAATSMEDILPLFEALPNPDKQLAVIPGGGHAVHLEKGRYRWYETVHAFLKPAG